MLIYLLLMEERYGRPLDWGYLWYSRPDKFQGLENVLVQRKAHEMAAIIARRNT